MKIHLEKHRLIIVGAGPAGIAAATRLVSNGFEDFLILEAENRIGGRVHNIPYDENITVDLGAQLIFGQKGNVVYEMANEFNLVYTECPDYLKSFMNVNSTGVQMDTDEANRMMRLLNVVIHEHMETHNGSLGQYVHERFKSELSKKKETSHLAASPYFDQFMEFFGKAQNTLDGSDSWFEVSAQGYGTFVQKEGCEYISWKKGGFGNLFKLLMKQMPGQTPLDVSNKILLNKEVTKINWEDNNGVLVTCADGTQYSADKVLITVSLGVLKSQPDLFAPPLPPRKKTAIEGLFFGTVDKIFVKFSKKWWPGVFGFNFFWSKEDEKNPLFKDTALVDGQPWIMDVYGFYITSEDPLTFVGCISGHAARYMESLTDKQVQIEVMKAFRFFLGAKYTIPEPARILTTSWGSNKHFRGSYSIRTLTTERLNTSAAELGAPVSNGMGKPVLLFAGEATSEDQYATVNGAIETGWREADRILKG
ncbi:hypothetical protein M8J75_002158 [Diaphorina citri]|nr:hypothetical protein M8J75_002158 [Diaphorina citri]